MPFSKQKKADSLKTARLNFHAAPFQNDIFFVSMQISGTSVSLSLILLDDKIFNFCKKLVRVLGVGL